jgi:hypothetical protein
VPPAASALAWPAFLGPLEAASQVAGSFSLNSSASRLCVLGRVTLWIGSFSTRIEIMIGKGSFNPSF